MAMPSSSRSEPPSATATATATATPRPPSNPPAVLTPSSPAQRSPQPNLFTVQSLPSIAPRPNLPQLPPQPRDSSIGYPLASSGRGFLPKSTRIDQTVTVARPVSPFTQGRAFAPDPNLPAHMARPTHLQHTLLGAIGASMPGVVKSGQPSATPKFASPQLSAFESNGYKDARDRSKDGSFATVRDRKVRITDGASLYALCRSWLKNGYPEESQPQCMDGVRLLPRPLPLPVGDENSPSKKEDDAEEEQLIVDDLSPQELLQRHIKRAKRVRSRLRDDRSKRIARYKTRLALLLPPNVEQQLRNDTTS